MGKTSTKSCLTSRVLTLAATKNLDMVFLSSIMYTFYIRIYFDNQHSHFQHHIIISQVLWLTCPSITSLTSSGATPVLESNSFITPEASWNTIRHI